MLCSPAHQPNPVLAVSAYPSTPLSPPCPCSPPPPTLSQPPLSRSFCRTRAHARPMAAEAKAPSLAEEYSLPQQEAPVEKEVDKKPQEAESIPVINDETPQADEITPAVEVNSETPEVQDAADKSEAEEANPAAEETTESAEEEAEEKPEIKIETAPADFRFPTTNQTRHCFTRYVEYHRCVAAKGEDAPECDKFVKYYRALCPGEWVERWNEQRENGTFPGPL
ncbi:hypothetical protein GUJ93_ZPchr0003g17853 [Zizania palustris]|uniref:Cytochrome c oxidase subunit n=1 Tax=Zizania palustris TaxID=103762 RepID=A0A8J5V796_ZIZPA|nr:hypothetical protein GUJ93_ZPchr0003g17853 [Zizania palustris]